jgi:hypothetical protein
MPEIEYFSIGLAFLLAFLSYYLEREWVRVFCVGGVCWFFLLALWEFAKRKSLDDTIVNIATGLICVGLIPLLFMKVGTRGAPNRERVKLYLGNADVYRYRQATEKDYWKIILPTEGINTDISKDITPGFIFGIDNQNDDIALENVHLKLNLDGEIQISGDGTDERSWKCQRPHKEYWFRFAHINPQDGHHPWNTLIMKFTRPGEYKLHFEISEKRIKQIRVECTIYVHPLSTTQLVAGTQGSLNPRA